MAVGNKLLLLCVGGIVTALIILKIMNVKIGAILPYGIILLCPLMHIFMMKGHGNHKKT